jgi:integrase
MEEPMKGYIRQCGKNRWQVVLDGGRAADGKRKQLYKTILGPKRLAYATLAQMHRDLQTGDFVEPDRLKTGEFLDKWLEDMRSRVAPKTWERYAVAIRRHIIPYIGQRLLKKLEPLDLTALYSHLLEKGRFKGGALSARSVRHTHVILRGALRQAVKWRLLTRDPSDAVSPPRPKRPEMPALADAEMAGLLEQTKTTRLYLPVLLAMSTGLRCSEIFALRWRDVDMEKGQLAVRQTLQEVRKTLYFRKPKSAKSRRTVALSAFVLEALKRHRASQAAERLSLGAAYRDLDLVLARWDGSPWKPESIWTLFRDIVRCAGLGHVCFHDLRHSHATQLLRLGVPAKVVSERLGHATIGITLDTYTHVLPGMQEEAAKNVGNLWAAGHLGQDESVHNSEQALIV